MISIRKAYRRKALELHPDRNFGNVDATTKQFTEVQSAYEILSDPQERAWYDSHRDAILQDRGNDDGDFYEHSIRMTTAEDILGIFRKFNGQIEFSDAPSGFYGTLREVFQRLAKEEVLTYESEDRKPIQYPSFGYANDNYETIVKPFYAMWACFASHKTFSWKDAYRYPEAPDRRIRRLMEKENKRLREEGGREFNDIVRSLVAFVRKRDPRVKPSKESEADRQKALRDASAAQATRSRATNQARASQLDAIPEWMLSSDSPESEISDENDSASFKEAIQCVLCKKVFKSKNQYEAHERSRKHIKAVQQFRKDVRREDANSGQDTTLNASSTTSQGANKLPPQKFMLKGEYLPEAFSRTPNGQEPLNESIEDDPSFQNMKLAPIMSDNPAAKSSSDVESKSDVSGEKIESRVLDQNSQSKVFPTDCNDINQSGLTLQLASQTLPQDKLPKVGKAKKKRAKKAASAKAEMRLSFKCATCQAEFPSKSKLFGHIRDNRHEQPIKGTL